jgi:hypothetical protein
LGLQTFDACSSLGSLCMSPQCQLTCLRLECASGCAQANDQICEEGNEPCTAHQMYNAQRVQAKNLMYEEHDRKRLEELAGKSTASRTLREQLDLERAAAAKAKEELKAEKEVTEELRGEVARLAAHVKDLESRKRPPLYQRKQEEELQVRLLLIQSDTSDAQRRTLCR